MPSGRLGHSAVHVEDKLFVLGGIDVSNNTAACKSDLWFYDLKTAHWSKINPSGADVYKNLPVSLFRNIPMTVLGKRIVILFSDRFNGTKQNKVVSYFPNTRKWTDDNTVLDKDWLDFKYM